jgi:hypothetical protein
MGGQVLAILGRRWFGEAVFGAGSATCRVYVEILARPSPKRPSRAGFLIAVRSARC